MASYPVVLQKKRRPQPARQAGSFLLNPVPNRALVAFTRSLAVLLQARVRLSDALETAVRQGRHQRMRALVDEVGRDVSRGASLSESLARHPAVFGAFYVQLVRVGEASGQLDEVLVRLAEYLEKAEALKRRVRLAMVYPVLVLTVALAATLFLLLVIVPTFAGLFADFGATLPGPTRTVVALSGLLVHYGWLVAGSLAVLGGGLHRCRRTPRGARVWDTLMLRLPLLGGLLRKSLAARFCRTLGTLLAGGVGLVEALPLLAEAAGRVPVEVLVQDIQACITQGGRLAEPLRTAWVFPPMVVQMITVGEETAQLDRMLLHVADHYDREVDEAVEALASVVEPVMIVLLGLILGGLLVALYLPMFDLVNVIGG